MRKDLWNKGYPYCENYKKLLGGQDIVLTKYKITIFCEEGFFTEKIGKY